MAGGGAVAHYASYMNLRRISGTLILALCVSATAASATTTAFGTSSLLGVWDRLPFYDTPTGAGTEPLELALFGMALSAFAFKLRRRKP